MGRSKIMKIIVDVMGGDNAPLELVKGACRAYEDTGVDLLLVGDKEQIERVAAEEKLDIGRFEILDAKETVEMTDDPLMVVRKKTESSMVKGLKALADGQGDAFVSTGNTGALFTCATLVVRRIKGVKRAGIGTVLPLQNPVLLLDSGANVVVEPEYLDTFAVMGSIYMKSVFGIESPRVGLLNNGSEECKGTELQIAAHKLLSSNENINFVGNIEGNSLTADTCDVIVTDGFTGNILIKTIEGMGKLLLGSLKGVFLANVKTKLSALLVKKQIGAMKKKFDSSEYGGAPFLGLRKPVIKAHGNSKAKAFASAIKQAVSFAESGVCDKTSDEIARLKKSAEAEIEAE